MQRSPYRTLLRSASCRKNGFTLIEMVIAIVIIGVGLAGVLAAFNVTVQNSADPLIRKQMLAIAEQMLEEVLSKPFTSAAPAFSNALVACGTAGAIRTDFNDVQDYNNYSTTGTCNIEGASVAGLGAYNVRVVTNSALSLSSTDGSAVPGIRIAVTVTHGTDTMTLIGWRMNY